MTTRNTLVGLAAAAALVLVGPAAPAYAITAIVKCSPYSPGPGEYGSISAALDAAKAASPRDHALYVYGTCAEIVQINALDYVQIIGQGSEGATLTYPPSLPGDVAVLTLYDTRGTRITNLTVTGNATLTAATLVTIFYSTNVFMEHVLIEKSGGTGVFINAGSTVHFHYCRIERNASEGVTVRAASEVDFGFPQALEEIIIRDNSVGIAAMQNSHVNLHGNVSIVNNSSIGVSARESTIMMCCQDGSRQISENGIGIYVVNGALRTQESLLVENNRSTGISLWGSKAQMSGYGLSHIVRSNRGHGVIARGGSSLDMSGSLVEHNAAAGVAVYDASAAQITDSTIQFNGAEGVAARFLSVAILGGTSITNNVGYDLFCAPDSVGRGTKTGVVRIFCPAFNQMPNPDPEPPR